MLARLFVIFGGLFVLVLCAALVVPYFVDWTGYRAEFERDKPERQGLRASADALQRVHDRLPEATQGIIRKQPGGQRGVARFLETRFYDAKSPCDAVHIPLLDS